MADDKELVARLRAFAKKWGAAEGQQDGELQLANEAASAIERLGQERDALREALTRAKYLISRMDNVASGVVVRDLDEAWSAYVGGLSDVAALNQSRTDA